MAGNATAAHLGASTTRSHTSTRSGRELPAARPSDCAGKHGCFGVAPTSTVQAGFPRFTYRVVNTYPHDRGAFTEGLEYVDGVLYEGTGDERPVEAARVG